MLCRVLRQVSRDSGDEKEEDRGGQKDKVMCALQRKQSMHFGWRGVNRGLRLRSLGHAFHLTTPSLGEIDGPRVIGNRAQQQLSFMQRSSIAIVWSLSPLISQSQDPVHRDSGSHT